MKKRLLITILSIIIICSVLFVNSIQCFAHSAVLDVQNDRCFPSIDDGIEEAWYSTTIGLNSYHLSHEELVIKYCFSNVSLDGTYGWTDAVSPSISPEEVSDIKEAYANSMKKWNNVYFYSYDNNGNVIKHKIIDVVEVVDGYQNLTIYPVKDVGYIAATEWLGDGVPAPDGIENHRHFSEWRMQINVYHFSSNNTDEESKDVIFDRNGAHELGHVLGIFDIDTECSRSDTAGWHHHELLMGYGLPVSSRVKNITYKDLAGVAITRGFHTDLDHQWINTVRWNDGTYVLFCAICNGVKYTSDVSNLSYVTYELCNDNHDLSSGNMMAVASYGNCDYYKCKYCRYVAPFSDIVPQDYQKTYYSIAYHKCENMVNGLEYTFFEPHNVIGNMCIDCGAHFHLYTHHYQQYTAYAHKAFCECGEYVLEEHSLNPNYQCWECGDEHEHTYGERHEWASETNHTSYCLCGESKIAGHVINQSAAPFPGGLKICLLCGGLVSEGFSQMAVGSLPHTENGSYITPDGITVLADEDIEAFLNGTLEFIYPSVGETS